MVTQSESLQERLRKRKLELFKRKELGVVTNTSVESPNLSKSKSSDPLKGLVSQKDNSGEQSNQKEKDVIEEDQNNMLKDLDEEEEIDDPEEYERRQEELLEEFLEQCLAEELEDGEEY